MRSSFFLPIIAFPLLRLSDLILPTLVGIPQKIRKIEFLKKIPDCVNQPYECTCHQWHNGHKESPEQLWWANAADVTVQTLTKKIVTQLSR